MMCLHRCTDKLCIQTSNKIQLNSNWARTQLAAVCFSFIGLSTGFDGKSSQFDQVPCSNAELQWIILCCTNQMVWSKQTLIHWGTCIQASWWTGLFCIKFCVQKGENSKEYIWAQPRALSDYFYSVMMCECNQRKKGEHYRCLKWNPIWHVVSKFRFS